MTTPPALRSGTVIAPGSPAAIASWSTIRISSVAVRPRICLARATSCTPGSWTTMRSAPCCWITGSATPSSFTRLCSVVMFCLSALSWMSFCAAGDSVATMDRLSPAPSSFNVSSRTWPRISSSAFVRVSASRNLISIEVGVLLMPVWRMFFSRSSVRMSDASVSSRLSTAARMSTCIRKCTPPRRSRPRYIGSARRLCSQRGVFDTRFSATT